MDSRELFLSHLEVIERIIRSVSRRHALSRVDEEEFGSTVRLRLMDNDYAIVRKFRRQSAFITYLTVVITNLFHDYRNERWGRWRPSAEARRLGNAGIRLETLMYRDGLPLNESIESVRSAMGDEAPSIADLRQMAARLAPRALPREIGETGLARIPAAQRADGGVLAEETLAEQELVAAAINEVLATLAPEDHVICRLLYWDGFTVAQVARALHLPQKPLYRRIEKLQGEVRNELEARGIDHARALDLLSPETE